MSLGIGGLILAFIFLACTALGAGVAWLFVRKTKKPIYWSLTPVFALLWFFVTAVPLVGLGFYLPMRAAAPATPPPPGMPAPAMPAPAVRAPAAPAPVVEPIDDEPRPVPAE